MKQINEAAQRELDRLRETNDGLLLPSAVVQFAKNEATALHAFFDWDDSDAANQWRLEQARRVIRLSVTVITEEMPPIRAMVSLTSDRKAGGGYRSLYDILDCTTLRSQMVVDALAELNVFKRKYSQLKQLAPIWDAIEQVEKSRVAVEEQPTV
jgi:hypothetical protein